MEVSTVGQLIDKELVMKWIKLTKFSGGERFAIPINRILSVHEAPDGSCVVTQEERGTLNTHVEQDYDVLVQLLTEE
jgi:hypothetical protein